MRDGILVPGRGDIKYAHRPGERIEASELREGMAVFERIVRGCGCA